MSHKYWLIIILVLAFTVRLAGINYGLPLWLIGDEPPFTTAALKMIELKTVFPALHAEEFKPTLYFLPYLSYLYLLPFVTLLGANYLFFAGNLDQFKNYIVSDLSQFFILARFINIILGTITVWLIYKIAKNIFKNEWAALLSAFFMSTSILHTYLSFVARDWVPATFLFTLGIYLLSNPSLSFNQRYLSASLVAGLAFGVSLIAPFLMLFILYWYLFYEHHSLRDVFKEKTLYAALIIFITLSAIAILLYPFGFHLSSDNTIVREKSLFGFFNSIFAFLKPIFISEPILALSAIAGIAFSYNRIRIFFWTAILFITSYASIFYLIYFYNQRYTIYLFPILSLLAGYGFWESYTSTNRKILKIIIASLILIPLVTILRFDWLVLKNDSRMQSRQWIETNLPEQSRILAYAELTRLASTENAIKEQKSIDATSLRKVDLAEMSFPKNPRGYASFHALNLYSVNNKEFYQDVESYAARNNYRYLLIDKSYAKQNNLPTLVHIAEKGNITGTFGSTRGAYLLRDGTFGSPINLWKLNNLGPQIEIYEITP